MRKKPPSDDQPDLFSAKEARNEAMKRVEDNAVDWMPLCMAAFLNVAHENQGAFVTGEDVRLLIEQRGIPPPHHHNAWGAVINNLVRGGFLEKTGKHVHMKTRRSHARATPLYRIPIKGEPACVQPSNTLTRPGTPPASTATSRPATA